jgi:YidC/Oxa1 family membrane protein insertase
MTRRQEPSLAGALLERFSPTGRFRFDPHIDTTESLLGADVMISEWSGAPLEYAFARERPAIFIDTPPKTHNAGHERIGLPCLEETIREEIGRVVAPSDIDTLPDVVRALLAEAPTWADRIRAARERTVFNVGRAGEVAAERILAILAGRRSIDG